MNHKNKYTEIPELSDFPTIQQEVFAQAGQLKAQVFERVADMILGRKATIEDGKDFKILCKIGSDNELIAYKDEVYGAITLRQGFEDGKWTIAWNFNHDIKHF